MPDQVDERSNLQWDIDDLLSDDPASALVGFAPCESGLFEFRIAMIYPDSDYQVILCKGWWKKRLRKLGRFVKKHKTAIIIRCAVKPRRLRRGYKAQMQSSMPSGIDGRISSFP